MSGRPYAEVIGDPIAHSKSPLIHNFWLEKLGIDAEYRACHVRADELEDYFAQRRKDAKWRGCNVTIPHKLAVLPLMSDLEGEAYDVLAVNCVVPDNGYLIGRNTDGFGVDAVFETTPDAACIIGAGGAAHAALGSLDTLCAMDVRLIVRNLSKGELLLRKFGHVARVFDFAHASFALHEADTVINASPLGMTGQPFMPREVLRGLGRTSEDAIVFDMVYSPIETELLAAARKLNRRAIDGLTMLIAQADASFFFFFGQPAPREHDAELRALLTV